MSKLKTSFDKWLQTGSGKTCNDFKSLKEQQYLTNRLWWAYRAGQNSDDIALISDVESVFKDLIKIKYRLPKYLQRRIQYILDSKENYTIKSL